MILLNFDTLDSIFNQVPDDGRRHFSYLKVTYVQTQALYILSGLHEKYDGGLHSRYLVPSAALNSSNRQRVNQIVYEKGASAGNASQPLDCQDGEMLDIYRVSNGDIIAQIRKVFEAYQNRDSLYMGRRATTGGATIDPADYVLTKRAVIEQWIGYLLGEQDQMFTSRKGETHPKRPLYRS